jgi:hypothetical protein
MAGTNKQSESYEGTAPAKYTGRKLKRTVHSPPQLVSTETRPSLPLEESMSHRPPIATHISVNSTAGATCRIRKGAPQQHKSNWLRDGPLP